MNTHMGAEDRSSGIHRKINIQREIHYITFVTLKITVAMRLCVKCDFGGINKNVMIITEHYHKTPGKVYILCSEA